jgi:hypothetical protein
MRGAGVRLARVSFRLAGLTAATQLLVACGPATTSGAGQLDGGVGPDGAAADAPPFPPGGHWALRAEIKAMIERSTCPEEPCPLVAVAPPPAPASPSSAGQRILLVDDGLVTQAATRYRSRVLAYLQQQDDRYVEFTPELQVPRDALEILSRIDDEPGEVSSVELDLVEDFKKFLPQMPDYRGHGMDILPFLAERAPEAQFLISEDQLESPTDCGILDVTADSDPHGSWQRFVEGMQRRRQSLSALIEKHGVNVIHLSWGIGHSTLVEEFQFHCQRLPARELTTRIMTAHLELFRSLTALLTPGPDGSPCPSGKRA